MFKCIYNLSRSILKLGKIYNKWLLGQDNTRKPHTTNPFKIYLRAADSLMLEILSMEV